MTPSERDPVSLAGVVLAGGASRRMGRDKATLTVPLPFAGPYTRGAAGAGSPTGFPAAPPGAEATSATTLVERAVDVVGQRCRPVFVMAAPGQALPELPARIMRDEVRGVGPLLATGKGLRAAAEAGAQWAFVCAVDMPFLTADVIEALARHAACLRPEVVLPWDGRDHYLAAVYRTDLADRVEALVAAGERSMRALVGTVDAQRIVMADPRPLLNLNSAADLQTLPGR